RTFVHFTPHEWLNQGLLSKRHNQVNIYSSNLLINERKPDAEELCQEGGLKDEKVFLLDHSAAYFISYII
ncbi:MAG: hypothetical protein K2Q15_08590, partial [Burkholderiales bacterium]|nr:hypothetical protein [Burkholderiales bacterium]